jgi:Fe-S cluster assembly ATPase SufC
VRVLIPYDRGDLASHLFDAANVEAQEHTRDGILLTVQMPRELLGRYSEYQVK